MILMLEDNAERLERFSATLQLIDPLMPLRVWRDAPRWCAKLTNTFPTPF